jgi:hypothetical protein
VTRFVIQPHRSLLTVRARSTLHPITRSGPVTGHVEATVSQGALDLAEPASGLVELEMQALKGDAYLDREMDLRLDTQRYPRAVARLTEIHPVDDGYRMRGEVVMRGRTCTVEGLAGVSVDSGRELRLHGSLRLDIRDFGIQPPRLLLLRVHPEVDVVLDFVALADGVAPG